MSLKKNLLLILTLLMVFAGCVGGDSSESGDNQFTSLPEYTLEQVLELSGKDDVLLGRPNSVVFDSAGNLLVMDLATYSVHVFDDEGIYQTSFGSQGEGPGEFQQPMRMLLTKQDTLYINDNIRGSLLVYSRNGDYDWEHAYDILLPQSGDGFPFYSLYPTDEGIPTVFRVRDDSDDYPNGYSTIKFINRNGDITKETDLKFNNGDVLEVNMNDMQMQIGLSELNSTEIAPHPDGSFIQAWTADPVLYQFSADGDTLNTMELEGYPIEPATSEAVSVLAERYGSGFGNIESGMEEAIGDFFPAFTDVMVMHDESIWLRKVRTVDTRQSWYHLAPEGVPSGTLLLGENESLRNAVANHVYVSSEADDGSPVIVKYRLSTSEI